MKSSCLDTINSHFEKVSLICCANRAVKKKSEIRLIHRLFFGSADSYKFPMVFSSERTPLRVKSDVDLRSFPISESGRRSGCVSAKLAARPTIERYERRILARGI